MTFEETTRTLQTVAENQARHDEMHARHSERIAEIEEGVKALIDAQVRYEARREELEEAFKLVARAHADMVEMIRRHEERLDGHDSDHTRTDGRLDALIDDQISARSRAEERGRLLDEKLARLAEAQRRADEQIRLLAARDGG